MFMSKKYVYLQAFTDSITFPYWDANLNPIFFKLKLGQPEKK